MRNANLNLRQLGRLVADLDAHQRGIPVLLERYLELGGRVLALGHARWRRRRSSEVHESLVQQFAMIVARLGFQTVHNDLVQVQKDRQAGVDGSARGPIVQIVIRTAGSG
jgi:hypothetical protein